MIHVEEEEMAQIEDDHLLSSMIDHEKRKMEDDDQEEVMMMTSTIQRETIRENTIIVIGKWKGVEPFLYLVYLARHLSVSHACGEFINLLII